MLLLHLATSSSSAYHHRDVPIGLGDRRGRSYHTMVSDLFFPNNDDEVVIGKHMDDPGHHTHCSGRHICGRIAVLGTGRRIVNRIHDPGSSRHLNHIAQRPQRRPQQQQLLPPLPERAGFADTVEVRQGGPSD